ncbi:MAG: cobalamin-binding protein [Clostridiaceae bacterium]|nr:cobalamin-binding protein [Clostridiaceae bacterium]MBW4859018.1 cobalamin-binding protein [Clostridiaceae bacterium]MBW4869593.1 cobalamin-binding protein [Clostridiaceae bacterium]
MKRFKNKKIIMLVLVLALTLAAFTGCGNSNKVEDNNEKVETEGENSIYPLEIEDQFKNKVTIEKEPQRIVSLAPSHTEILFSLGLRDKIVGVTSFCDYPEEAKGKDKIGDFEGINIEKVIELEPDLVVQYGKGDKEINNKIKEAGIPIVSYEPESVDGVIDTINEIGKITGKEEKAKKITDDMKAKKDEIVDKVKDEKSVKVFYEIWHEPLTAAGPGSFMDELIKLSGGENIAKDAEGEYPNFDQEQLIERNPDVYLAAEDPEKTVESIKTRPGYETINAVKNDKVYLLEPNIVSRPGPRIVEALELVAKALHPDSFE